MFGKHSRVRERVAAIILCGFVTSPAHAADPREEAAEYFRKGREAYGANDFAGAARSFESAYEKVPRAAAIYNAALAWVLAKEPARAANAFQVALEKTDLHGPEAADAKARLAKLTATLGILEVISPEGSRVTVEPLAEASSPVKTYLPAGTHEIRVLFPNGKTSRRSIEMKPGARLQESFQTPADNTPLGQPSSPTLSPSVLATTPRHEDHTQKSTQKTIGWILLGASGLSAGGAAYLGTRAVDTRDSFVASGESNASMRDDAVKYRTMTNVAWGSAAVLAGTGLVLILTSSK